ncbi:unnamed protein product [Zymoseptoria tritici ST99CH_3D1]|nr:unnamed protein product [Zymoseptoria tritici ST99CH_3D1]
MRPSLRHNKASTVLALLAAPVVYAQGNNNNNQNNNDNDLPDLNTITNEAAQSTQSAASSRASTQTDDANTAEETDSASSASSATFPDAVTSSSTFAGLKGLPTIAGAGVPDLVIPFTEAAPFMQRSSMPEGTVFIAVGAVLALFGACILLWRVLVAWSINRSVKRSAIASIRGGGEKSSGNTWAPHSAGKAAYYKEYETGSSMSLDQLNSQGKPLRPFRDDHDAVKRQSSAPVNGLFFSPTAQTSNRASSAVYDNRASAYLPAGYYASPSADIAGARSSTYGASSLAPYARHSQAVTPSPPETPDNSASRSTSAYYGAATSRDGTRPHDRQGQSSRDGRYAGASSSSLAVGIGGNAHGNEYLGGQRAPSQVFDDMLDVHGNGPRERY